MDSKERVARNFIKSRGKAQFRMLISMLEQQESAELIGQKLGVSRERVRQWKNTFGITVSTYAVDQTISQMLMGRKKDD